MISPDIRTLSLVTSESQPLPLANREGGYSSETLPGYRTLQGHYGISVTDHGNTYAPSVSTATTASKRFDATKDLHTLLLIKEYHCQTRAGGTVPNQESSRGRV